MANIATITNNIISALSGTTSQVLLGDATLTDFKLDSLTDVNVPTPGDGDVLKWNATTSLWEASDAAGVTGSGTTNYLSKFTSGGVIGNSQIFDNGTNVGIGIVTPDEKLHVGGGRIKTSVDATGAAYLVAQNSSGGTVYGTDGTGGYILTNWSAPILFYTNNTERMRLTNIGRLGINTTAPTQTLHVEGTFRSYFDAFNYLIMDGTDIRMSANAAIIIGDNSTDSVTIGAATGETRPTLIKGGPISLMTSGVTRVTVAQNGDVGIGTTSPLSKLHINGGRPYVSLNSGSDGVVLGGDSSVNTPYSYITTTNDGAQKVGMAFHTTSNATAGTEKMRIMDNGNVGIGTASPSAQLTLNNATEARFRMNVNGVNQIIFNHDGSTGVIRTESATPLTFGSFGSERMRISPTGDLLIGLTSNFTGGPKVYIYKPTASEEVFRVDGIGYGAGIVVSNTATAVQAHFGGNVGIGIANPTKKLTIGLTDAAHSDEGILFQSPSGYGEAGIYHDYNQGNGLTAFKIWNTYSGAQINLAQDFYNSAGSPGSIRFYTAPSSGANTIVERMRITPTGNVGIGTSAPISKLEVFDGDISVSTSGSFSFFNNNRNFIPNSSGVLLGGMRFRGYSTGSTYQVGAQILSFSSASWTSVSTPSYLSFQTTPSGTTSPVERMTITSDGNVGIGTTTPYGGTFVTALDINASVYPTLALSVAGTFVGGVLGFTDRITLHAPLSRYLSFDTNDTERLRITVAGNVGIGTTTPAAKLTVSGTSAETYINNGDTNTLVLGNFSGGRHFIKSINLGVALTPLTLQASSFTFDTGNVGIGTTAPAEKIDVFGRIQARPLSNGSVGNYWYMIGSITDVTNFGVANGIQVDSAALNSYAMTFGTQNTYLTGITEKMRITSGGNVGISTTNPTEKLHVVGNSLITNSSTDTVFTVSSTWSHAYFNLSRADNSSLAYLQFRTGATNNWQLGTPVGGTFLWLLENGTERLRIANGGAATFSSSVTATNLNLTDAGGGIINNQTGNIFLQTVAGGSWIFRNGSPGFAEFMRLDSSGNLAIGTSTVNGYWPSNLTTNNAKLGVYYSDSSTSLDNANAGLVILNTSATANTSSKLVFGAYNTDPVAVSLAYISATNDLRASGYMRSNLIFATASANGSPTGPTEKMRLTTDGNLGIGTTTPNPYSWAARTLTVSSSVTNSFAALEAYGNGTGAGALLLGNNTVLRASIVGVDGSHLTFATNGNNTGSSQFERMRITATGLVGMGTTTPTAGYRLTLATGGMILTGTQATAGVTGAIDTQGYTMANANNQILNYFYANGVGNGFVTKLAAAVFRVQTSGTRYTTSTAYGIHVESAIKGVSTDIGSAYGIAVEDQTAGNTNNYGIWSNVSSGTNRWNIFVPGTADNYFAGNVGIGTTTPDLTDWSASANGLQINDSIWAVLKLTGSTGKFWLASGSVGTYLYQFDANPLYFGTNNTERMRLDAAGNLGLGVVPSAWGGGVKGFELPNSAYIATQGQYLYISANTFFNGTNNIYKANGFANLYAQDTGRHIWFNAPNNTSGAGATATFTQAMTLDASGNLGIGTGATTPVGRLHVRTGTNLNLVTSTQLSSVSLEAVNDAYSANVGLVIYGNPTRILAGNIIINDSASDSGERLQVTGTAKITGATTLNSTLTLSSTGSTFIVLDNTTATTGRQWRASAAGNGRFFLTNVTDAIDVLTLQTTGAATFNSSVTSTAFIPSAATIPTNGMYLPTTNTLGWSTNSIERLRLDAAGNLGIGTSSPNSKFQVNGSVSKSITTKTAAYTLTDSDYTVIGNTNLSAFTFTLPTAVGRTGRIYVIKNAVGGNILTVDANASETIDGYLTYILQCQSGIIIQSDGANWHVIADINDQSCLFPPN